MIDPIATVIAFLAQSPPVYALTQGRVAAKHKYGLGLNGDYVAPDAWVVGAQALRIQPGGGTPDINASVQRLDLLVTCFGESQARAMDVYRGVVTTCRGMVRSRVPTQAGDALLYTLNPVGAPAFGFEVLGEQIGVDMVTVTLRTSVSECPIPLPVTAPPMQMGLILPP